MIIPIKVTRSEYSFAWILGFLKDLTDLFEKWSSKSSSYVMGITTPLDMNFTDGEEITLKSKKWKPVNQADDWLTFEYAQSKTGSFKLMISIHQHSFEIQVWNEDGKDVISVLLHGLEYNHRNNSYSFLYPYISVRKRDNKEFNNKRGSRRKLIPQFDLNVELWLRNLYLTIYDRVSLAKITSLIATDISRREWFTDKFYLSIQDDGPVFVKFDCEDVSTPEQLIEEFIKNQKKKENNTLKARTFVFDV